MHIEEVEALTAWLEHRVSPLCDADPKVLSQYILALVKKHETPEGLISGCNKNLELFFNEKTQEFVTHLAEIVTSKSYITWFQNCTQEMGKHDLSKARNQSLVQEAKKSCDDTAGQEIRSKPVQGLPRKTSMGANSPKKSQKEFDNISHSNSSQPEGQQRDPASRDRGRTDRPNQNERFSRTTWKHSSPFVGRGGTASGFRHQQGDRHKRHYSLEKGTSVNTTHLPARQTSPQPERGHPQGSDHDWPSEQHHRPEPLHSTGGRPAPQPRKSRAEGGLSSSLDRVGGRFRKRSRSAARSSSRSPSARSDSSRSSLESFASKCSASKRIHVDREQVNSRSSTPLEENGDTILEPFASISSDVDPPRFRPRCRDYDEKGYCIQGKMCPYDHGVDPVVMESSRLPPSFSYQVGGLTDSLATGQAQRSVIAPYSASSLLPNISHPVPFRPPTMPPAHFMPPHMALPPAPTFYPPPIAVCTGQLTGHADAYLSEPYEPRASRTVVVGTFDDPNTAWLSQDSPSYPPLRNAAGLMSATRHNNLVRIPTQDETPDMKGASEPRVSDVTSVQVGTKRKADTLDQDIHSRANKVLPPVKKPAPEHPGVRHENSQVSSTTLELRKVPREQNTIANINDHFSKFGIIVNLQVGWEGDPQAALVSFASSAQAAAAYRSREPFLNNRFIKIFWHNVDKQQQQQPVVQQQSQVAPVSGNEIQPHPKRHTFPERHQLQLNNILKKAAQPVPKVVCAAGKNPGEINLDVTTVSSEVPKVAAPVPESTVSAPSGEAQPAHHRVSLTKINRKPVKQLPHKTEVLKKQQDLEQQSRNLLSKYIEQQKALFEKLERDKGTMSAEDRADVIQTIKKLAADIEALRSRSEMMKKTELATSTVVRPRPTVPRGSLKKVNVRRSHSGSGKELPQSSTPKSPHVESPLGSVLHDQLQAQKAILDTELDLMTSNSETKNEELRKKVLTLKAEAAALGLLGSGQGHSVSHAGQGGGSTVPGRRWAVPRYRTNALTVDRRPKQLLITGFLAEEKDQLLAHISSFGLLENNSFDMSVPSLLVSFKLRITAEKVASEGCNFNGKKLTMVWQKSVLSELNTATSQPNSDVIVKSPGDLKASLSGENLPSPKKLSHAASVQRREFDDEPGIVTTEPVLKSPRDGRLLSQDSVNEADDILTLDEEDEDDDEEERPWRR